ncbi:zf-HC2 domain-containing protein [Actinokineospora sp. NBRC 105648]|uniref:zf-HC2 domain-containing protein n=1 Tax=Actinokineospora sp. NBRC 105648 TaxID=3032206 RepID=UPI0024A31093|nr:zf-HC2 domain-containing protein [Actinokineospora sp. NBRC 105648]GLZ38694.1 hypothetical protein Acsp05_23180 [Actinokineospora sp. NBRC 105648]
MSTRGCPPLGAYALGVLDDEERRVTELHLAGCAPCRVELDAVRAMLELAEALPPEALLRTRPTDDLLLRRTLRQVRAEAGARRTRVRILTAAAAGVVVAAAVGVGVLVGRSAPERAVAEQPPQQPSVGREPTAAATTHSAARPADPTSRTATPPRASHPTSTSPTAAAEPTAVSSTPTTTPTTTSPPPPPEVPPPAQALPPTEVFGTDPTTGVRLTAALTSENGWVRVTATVTGVPDGKRCALVVVTTGGVREQAASWVSAPAPAQLSGAAAVRLGAVAAVEVVGADGTRYISARP